MKLLSRICFMAVVLAATGHVFTVLAQIPRFLDTVRYPVKGAGMEVLADVNGDGILDIVTANQFAPTGDGGVSVLLGVGNGAFRAAKQIVAGGSPSAVIVGDFNNDGKPDIAVANEPNPSTGIVPVGGPNPNSVSILLGNGDGTFRPSIDTPTAGATGFVAADFNNDGKLDLAVAAGQLSPVQILLNNGGGTFTVNDSTMSGLFELITGDFNKDGKADVLAGGFVNLGNGDGTFTQTQGLDSFPAIAADFNGDGVKDLASLFVSDGRIITGLINFGLPDGTFAPSFISDFSGYGIVAADFNGDGITDIFGTGGPTGDGIDPPIGGLGLGVGDGTFTFGGPGFGAPFGISIPAAFPAAGDLDGNGSPDVAIANGSSILVALNTSGHPPLLAQFTTDATFVVGGKTTVKGTVSLGGPAPKGGAIVTLASNNPAAVVSAKVKIPATKVTASFTITTNAVTAPTPVTISASYHATKLTAQINIVPAFTLASVSFAPASLIGMFGGDPAVGTVTLSGPAANGTVVNLASANPSVATVPASVTFAPGTSAATFPVSALHVASDIPVAVSATLQANTRSANITVLKETATVAVAKAEYVVKKGQLTVEATSTDRVASLQVFNPTTGTLLGTIPLVNVGKFTGQIHVTGSLTSIAVQSSLGGLSIANVTQK